MHSSKLRFFLFAALVGLFAHDGKSEVIPQYYDGKLEGLLISEAVRGTPVCTIDIHRLVVRVTAGKSDECWHLAARAHNRVMDDPENHATADRVLRLVATKLGKQYRECVQ